MPASQTLAVPYMHTYTRVYEQSMLLSLLSLTVNNAAYPCTHTVQVLWKQLSIAVRHSVYCTCTPTSCLVVRSFVWSLCFSFSSQASATRGSSIVNWEQFGDCSKVMVHTCIREINYGTINIYYKLWSLPWTWYYMYMHVASLYMC